MRPFSLVLTIALCSCFLGVAEAPAQKPADSGALDAVVKKMDAAAANFRTTRADVEWDRYEKVINEVDDVQTGEIYYRRAGQEIEMKIDIKMDGGTLATLKSEPKYVLLRAGKISVYQPKPDQVTLYDLGKNSSEFGSYLALGFGSSGQDLVKTFDVTYLGPETINGIATAKLQLIPKSERVRNNFRQILLWIDLDRGISVQQQLFEPQGDYRLAKYSAIRVNEKINNDVFQLKTTGKTTTISPRG